MDPAVLGFRRGSGKTFHLYLGADLSRQDAIEVIRITPQQHVVRPICRDGAGDLELWFSPPRSCLIPSFYMKSSPSQEVPRSAP